MISEFYENPRPYKWKKNHVVVNTTPVVSYTPPMTTENNHLFPYQRADKIGITVAQWLDREKVVQELTADHDFEMGDLCWPNNEAGYKKYGVCKITGITRSYAEFDHNKDWPSNDNPMLLRAVSLNDPKDKQEDFICTTNFLTKEKPDYATE